MTQHYKGRSNDPFPYKQAVQIFEPVGLCLQSLGSS